MKINYDYDSGKRYIPKGTHTGVCKDGSYTTNVYKDGHRGACGRVSREPASDTQLLNGRFTTRGKGATAREEPVGSSAENPGDIGRLLSGVAVFFATVVTIGACCRPRETEQVASPHDDDVPCSGLLSYEPCVFLPNEKVS